MARATLHMTKDDGQLKAGLTVYVNDCVLSFHLSPAQANAAQSYLDHRTARKDVLRMMVKNFIYASGLLLAIVGVYHL